MSDIIKTALKTCLIFLTVNGLYSQTSANYTITKWVLDQGGKTSQSANYFLQDVIGQPSPPGAGTSTDYVESSGFITGGTLSTEVVELDKQFYPGKFRLLHNYPNPFNPITTIQYEVKTSCHVELKVFDLMGRELVTLVDAVKQIGQYSIQFDASGMPSGVYFYKIRMKNFVNVKKMVLLE